VAGVDPDVGETLSQLPPELVVALAVQFNAPALVLILICCDAGFAPAVELNVSEEGVALRSVEATSNVTVIVVGLLVAPAAVTVTVAL
jgi:hypothetical protein